ncbi:hypothetical protein ACP0KD_05535 [Pseudomonas aeruginosa]
MHHPTATAHDLRLTVIDGVPYIALSDLPPHTLDQVPTSTRGRGRPRKAPQTPPPAVISREQYLELSAMVESVMKRCRRPDSANWWAWKCFRDLAGDIPSAEFLPPHLFPAACALLEDMAEEAQHLAERYIRSETRMLQTFAKRYNRGRR